MICIGEEGEDMSDEKKPGQWPDNVNICIEPHKRPRPAHWPPNDYWAAEYESSIIPALYCVVEGEVTLSYDERYRNEGLLLRNDKMLLEQKFASSPVFAETEQDVWQANVDAKADMRESYRDEKLARRAAAVEAGDCKSSYFGHSWDECKGEGFRLDCVKCSGQAVKLLDHVDQKSRRTGWGGARSKRITGSQVYDGPPE